MWLMKRTIVDGWATDKALDEATQLGLAVLNHNVFVRVLTLEMLDVLEIHNLTRRLG